MILVKNTYAQPRNKPYKKILFDLISTAKNRFDQDPKGQEMAGAQVQSWRSEVSLMKRLQTKFLTFAKIQQSRRFPHKSTFQKGGNEKVEVES